MTFDPSNYRGNIAQLKRVAVELEEGRRHHAATLIRWLISTCLDSEACLEMAACVAERCAVAPSHSEVIPDEEAAAYCEYVGGSIAAQLRLIKKTLTGGDK